MPVLKVVGDPKKLLVVGSPKKLSINPECCCGVCDNCSGDAPDTVSYAIDFDESDPLSCHDLSGTLNLETPITNRCQWAERPNAYRQYILDVEDAGGGQYRFRFRLLSNSFGGWIAAYWYSDLFTGKPGCGDADGLVLDYDHEDSGVTPCHLNGGAGSTVTLTIP